MKNFTLEAKLYFLDTVLSRCEELLIKHRNRIGCSINCKALTEAIKVDLETIDKINDFEKYKGN